MWLRSRGQYFFSSIDLPRVEGEAGRRYRVAVTQVEARLPRSAIDYVEGYAKLVAGAVAGGARLVVFPELHGLLALGLLPFAHGAERVASALSPRDHSTPSPSDPGGKLAGSVEEPPIPSSAIRNRQPSVSLWQYWWVPLFTLVLALGGAMSYVFWRPSTYVSTATLYVPMTFSLPGGNLMTEDPVTFWGTQTELLKCPRLRALTLESLSNRTTQALPLGRDGQPLPVHISLTHRPKSPVFLVSATGSLPAYTERYLDALLVQFFNYKQNVRREVSGATLASISGQVQKAERDLKSDQDAFQTFERTNRLAVLQSCATGAVDNLMKLSIQSSDLQLEERLVRHSAPAEAASLEAIRLKITLSSTRLLSPCLARDRSIANQSPNSPARLKASSASSLRCSDW